MRRTVRVKVQVPVTTHSPDLLDDKALSADELLAVGARDGRSGVGPIDEAGRTTLRKRLCTPGELLRLGQIRPDPKIFESETRRTRLFDRNLTEAALDRNIEMGLPVRDRALAASLIGHFDALIHDGGLARLPPS